MSAQVTQTGGIKRDRGNGPYDSLVIKNAMIVDGTGAAPYGPADIYVSGNRIAAISEKGGINSVKHLDNSGKNTHIIDASEKYIMPGFVDSHAHIGNSLQAPNADYVYKLWLAHGVTSVRELGSLNGLEWTVDQARKSERNEIAAPRLFPFAAFKPGVIDRPEPRTAKDATAWVQRAAEIGAAGVKFFAAAPAAFKAAITEAKRLGLGTACHHDQRTSTQANAALSTSWGLDSIEHWYGIPEAMFEDRTVQHVPLDYNHNSEPQRFAEGANLWLQTAQRGSDKWQQTLELLLQHGSTLCPTFNIYIGSRDAARVRTSEWHEEYTSPTLWNFFTPSPDNHGSYMGNWTSVQEAQWRRAYQKWMSFVNDYKNLGGRVTAGSDSGFIYKVFGFGFIEELELLLEAGFHPLEVLRSATLSGAELLNRHVDLGSVEEGKYADLVLIDGNPLENFKPLYANGHLCSRDGINERQTGIAYTIKDGIVYDCEQLRADIRDIVEAEKE